MIAPPLSETGPVTRAMALTPEGLGMITKQQYGSALSLSVWIAMGFMNSGASAITAELAKRCQLLTAKAYPSKQVGNPAASATTGPAARAYFSKCVANKGNVDAPLPQPAQPVPPR